MGKSSWIVVVLLRVPLTLPTINAVKIQIEKVYFLEKTSFPVNNGTWNIEAEERAQFDKRFHRTAQTL